MTPTSLNLFLASQNSVNRVLDFIPKEDLKAVALVSKAWNKHVDVVCHLEFDSGERYPLNRRQFSLLVDKAGYFPRLFHSGFTKDTKSYSLPEINKDTVENLLELAQCCKLNFLKEKCDHFLKTSNLFPTLDEVIFTFHLCLKYNLSSALEKKCEDFFSAELLGIFSKEGYRSSPEHLTVIKKIVALPIKHLDL